MISHNPLLRFMAARHYIFHARQGGAKGPWTNDLILRDYRFCNVYREHDTVTRWIDAHIRRPFAVHPHLWFWLAVARQINWPPTLAALIQAGALGGGSWPAARARKLMLDMKAAGQKVYTGAYMLNAHGRGPADPDDKAFFTCHLVLAPLWRDREKLRKVFERGTMRAAWEALLPYHGWGGFTAYEVVCDAVYTRYGESASWRTDADTWAHAGPGAVRGLNRLLGRPVKSPMAQAEALRMMQELLAQIAPEWEVLYGAPNRDNPRLRMREIEHSLCEFDKYERARLGEGRPRSRYNPSGEH